MEILTVCTANIWRSPFATLVLAKRLTDVDVVISSAGVRGLRSAQMASDAASAAVLWGVDEADTLAHRSRWLTEGMLVSPDLILAMTRDHRRAIAELAPSRLRATFTVREFARLAAELSDDEVARVAGSPGGGPSAMDASARLRAIATAVAARRGLVSVADPADDDVVDPYGLGAEAQRLAIDQLIPALAQAERIVRFAVR